MKPGDEASFDELAVRYLSGETTSAERERLVGLLQQPARHERFEELRRAWDAGKTMPVRAFDVQAAQAKLRKAIARERPVASRRKPPLSRPGRVRGRRAWIWAAGAALAAAAVIVGPGLWQADADRPAALVERASGVGERTVVTLRDGTKITLNSGSKLRYPDDFDRYSRVVTLEGEAFFEVSPDPARPFVVETARVRTAVLGTKFNVRAFPEDASTRVALVEGRVQVIGTGSAGESKPALLMPGEEYTFDAATGRGEVKRFNPEIATGWLDNLLVLDHEPVASAARKLERRFGIRMDASDPRLATEYVSAKFKDESVEEILELLHLTGVLEFQVQRTGGRVDRVIITAASPPPPAP